MRRRTLWSLRAAAIALTLSARAMAAEPPPSQPPPSQVTPIFAHELPNVPGDSLTSLIVAYPPGGKSHAHRHADSGFIFAYVLSGAIRSQVEGETPKVYQAGESWYELPGAHHVVSENASDSEPARLLVVFVAKTGDKLTTPDP